MSNAMNSIVIVTKAAFSDTLRNIFRPVHNIKVVLGIVEPDSIEKVISDKEKEAASRPTPMP